MKALACERPVDARRVPLSRFSVVDVCGRAWDLGLTLSYSTIWRRLKEDALRPWLYQQWLFPRDPLLLEKATPVLELYHGRWEGQPLGPRDLVICADEMSGLQAVSRIHAGMAPYIPCRPPLPGRPGRRVDRRARSEFEYERHGTVCYQAFLNVFTGTIYGEVQDVNGIETFEQAFSNFLRRHCELAEHIFLIVDNGSAHHPNTSPARLQAKHPNVTVVHLPTHSSWLNQIELYFSIIHRKALAPADFGSVDELKQRILWFQWHYNSRSAPFNWQYSRSDLEAYIERLAVHEEIFQDAVGRLRQQREAAAGSAYCLMN